MLGGLLLAAFLAEPPLDPLFQLADRVDADAELDEVKGHGAVVDERRP
jgi:hypothetical protein